MSIYKRGEIWWIDVADPITGERVRKSTGERERVIAKRLHDAFAAELWRRRRSGGTLHGALDSWAKGKGEPDRYRVGKLKRLVPDWNLDAIEDAKLKALLPQKTPGTFNRYLTVLQAAGIKLEVDGKPVKPKKTPKGRIRWLTASEWKKLRKELPAWQQPMADFALSTGLRQSNVFRLEWSQVDMEGRVAWIHPDQTKGRKALRVKLQPAAMKVLEAQVGQHDRWVFVSEKDSESPPVEIKVGWAAALRRAKIPHATWHDLRHTWATWHLMNGTPLEVLKELGGWADLRMVLRYAHLAESHIDKFAGNSKPYEPRHNPRHNAA